MTSLSCATQGTRKQPTRRGLLERLPGAEKAAGATTFTITNTK